MKVTDLRRKLIAALAAGGLIAPGMVHAAELNTNLLINSGFENVDFTGDLGNYGAPRVLDWIGTGFAYSHDGSGGIPDYANGGPLAGGGSYYFTPGRPGDDITGPGIFYQDVDVSTGSSGTLIASGAAAYKVGAFFSSYLTQGDFGNVHLDFLDNGSASLGTAVVSPIDTSTWTQNFRGGLIPVGTATVRVSLFGTPLAGSPDGYMDIVDFQVTNEVLQPALELTVDRDTGGMTLSNRTGGAVNVKSYSITSAFEGLVPANWLSIADNYDAGSPGPNQLDAANDWSELTDPDAHGDLSEADLESATGFSFGHTDTVDLGAAGTWLQTPTEDLVFQYISGGEIVQGLVTFTGNGDVPLAEGDLNADGEVNSADWMILRTNQHTDMSGDSLAEAYRRGDLTGDRQNNHPDFVEFKALYDAANGAGAFAAMVAAVPEPAAAILVLTAGLFALPTLRRARHRA